MPICRLALVLVTTTWLAGCGSPSMRPSPTAAPVAATPPALHPVMIDRFGTHTTADGAWRVGVSERVLELSRSDAFGDGKGLTMSGWTTTSPESWATHPGWFVYVESDSRVWAYDGARQLFLETETADGSRLTGRLYCNAGFPCAVPPAVSSRLSGAAMEAIQSNHTDAPGQTRPSFVGHWKNEGASNDTQPATMDVRPDGTFAVVSRDGHQGSGKWKATSATSADFMDDNDPDVISGRLSGNDGMVLTQGGEQPLGFKR